MLEIIKAELKSHKWLFIGTPIVLLVMSVMANFHNEPLAYYSFSFYVYGLAIGFNLALKFENKKKLNYNLLPIKMLHLGVLRVFIPYFYTLLVILCSILLDVVFGYDALASFKEFFSFAATVFFIWSFYTILSDLSHLFGFSIKAVIITIAAIGAVPIIAYYGVVELLESENSINYFTLLLLSMPLLSILSCQKRATSIPVIVKFH